MLRVIWAIYLKVGWIGLFWNIACLNNPPYFAPIVLALNPAISILVIPSMLYWSRWTFRRACRPESPKGDAAIVGICWLLTLLLIINTVQIWSDILPHLYGILPHF